MIKGTEFLQQTQTLSASGELETDQHGYRSKYKKADEYWLKIGSEEIPKLCIQLLLKVNSKFWF